MNPVNPVIDLPLRDIHLPDPISWWPLAIGWWIVIGCSALLILGAFILIYRTLRQTLKKQAIKRLDKIEDAFLKTTDASTCISEISILLRRIVITQNPKNAGVTGEAWLRLLDGPEKKEFSQGIGQILLTGPYQSHVNKEEVNDLIKLCRKMVKNL